MKHLQHAILLQGPLRLGRKEERGHRYFPQEQAVHDARRNPRP